MKINIENNIAIKSADKMIALCRPLQALDIPFFRYIKIMNDGARCTLCNQPDLLRFIYENQYYPITWWDNGKPGHLYNAGHALWAIDRADDSEEQTQMEKEILKLFTLSQGITFLIKSPGFTEAYEFCSNSANIYKISISLFRRFIFYFKDKAAKLIQGASSDKIVITNNIHQSNINHSTDKENFLKSTPIKRHYLHGDLESKYLTVREADCLNWCVKGKSADQIAKLLGTSCKTIERHIENIKQKFNCSKQSQLVRIAISQGLIYD